MNHPQGFQDMKYLHLRSRKFRRSPAGVSETENVPGILYGLVPEKYGWGEIRVPRNRI